jgi:hypothetical protein
MFNLGFQQLAVLVLVAALACIAVTFLVQKVKALFISGTMVIQREVDAGEHVTFHVNIYSFDNQNAVYKRISHFAEAGIKRKEFCFNRFQEILEHEGKVKTLAKQNGA